MERWEYRVVSLRSGTYTASLNEYGREGWELISVTAQPKDAPPPETKGSRLPIPGTLGRLEGAAAQLNKLGGGDSTEAPVDEFSNLLWVLRRPLIDEDAPHPFDDPHAEF